MSHERAEETPESQIDRLARFLVNELPAELLGELEQDDPITDAIGLLRRFVREMDHPAPSGDATELAIATVRAFIVEAVGADMGDGMTDQAADLVRRLAAKGLLTQPADDCGHPEHVSQRQIDACLGGAPRTWPRSAPEPGTDVTSVSDSHGKTWVRDRGGWNLAEYAGLTEVEGIQIRVIGWLELLECGPLTEVAAAGLLAHPESVWLPDDWREQIRAAYEQRVTASVRRRFHDVFDLIESWVARPVPSPAAPMYGPESAGYEERQRALAELSYESARDGTDDASNRFVQTRNEAEGRTVQQSPQPAGEDALCACGAVMGRCSCGDPRCFECDPLGCSPCDDHPAVLSPGDPE